MRQSKLAWIIALILAVVAAQSTSKRKKSKKSHKTEISQVRFAALKYDASWDPVKVVRDLDKVKVDAVAILGAKGDKVQTYLDRFQEHAYETRNHQNDVIMATRQKSELKGRHLIYKLTNGRQIVLRAFNGPASLKDQNKTFKTASHELKDQDPDMVIFQLVDDKPTITVPTYWKRVAREMGETGIVRDRVKMSYADYDIPDAKTKMSAMKDENGSGLPWWGWLIIIIVIPLVVGIIAMIVISVKSKKAQQAAIRTL